MSELQRYPALKALLGDLRTLTIAESVAAARERKQGVKITDNKHLSRVEWSGQFFWLDPGQREVLRVLLDARLNSATPDVDEGLLLRRSMVPGLRRLADLFAGHPCWGRLIVRGERPATFRAAPPRHDDQGDGDQLRVDPE